MPLLRVIVGKDIDQKIRQRAFALSKTSNPKLVAAAPFLESLHGRLPLTHATVS